MAELSRSDSNQMRTLGRGAAETVARIARDAARDVGVSRDFATVTKVGSDGTVEVNFGTSSAPMNVGAIRTTVDCASVNVGDVVVVDTYAHVPLVTGIVSTANNSPWNWISEKIDATTPHRFSTDKCISDCNTCGTGYFHYAADTANRPNDWGLLLSFAVQDGNWLFQVALPTSGDPHWRRNINGGGWSSWWTWATA